MAAGSFSNFYHLLYFYSKLCGSEGMMMRRIIKTSSYHHVTIRISEGEEKGEGKVEKG